MSKEIYKLPPKLAPSRLDLLPLSNEELSHEANQSTIGDILDLVDNPSGFLDQTMSADLVLTNPEPTVIFAQATLPSLTIKLAPLGEVDSLKPGKRIDIFNYGTLSILVARSDGSLITSIPANTWFYFIIKDNSTPAGQYDFRVNVLSVMGVTASNIIFSTTPIAEGSNLYYTDARVQTVINNNKSVANGLVAMSNYSLILPNETSGAHLSYLSNFNTASRQYDLQDRDGTLLDDTDYNNILNMKNALNGFAGIASSGYRIQIKNSSGSATSTISCLATAARDYGLQDRSGTLLDDTDYSTLIGILNGKANTGGSNATGTWPISISGSSATSTTVPALSGDITTTGLTNVTTLKNTGSAGTYTKVTTDAAGRVSVGTTLAAGDIPLLLASKISNFDSQVATDIASAVGVSVQAFNAKLQSLSTVTGLGSISGNTNFILTNPLKAIYTMNMGPSGVVTLPVMNAANSPVPDSLIVFVNTGSQANNINFNDGSTCISQLPTGAIVFFFVTSNATTNGAFIAYRTDTAAITSGSINGITTFASSASSNFFGTTNSGSINSTLVSNPSNTASSDAVSKVSVGGSSAGDAFFQAIISGVTTCSFGLDNSDSDAFVMSMSSTLGTFNVLRLDTNGNITKPLSTNFFTYYNLQASNVTGDGTIYTLTWGTSLWDYNSNISGSTFTAKTAAKYRHHANIGLTGITSAHTTILISLVTTARTYQVFSANLFNFSNAAGNALIPCVVEADMAVNDTATWTVLVSGPGGTKVVSVFGVSSGTQRSFWSGEIMG